MRDRAGCAENWTFSALPAEVAKELNLPEGHSSRFPIGGDVSYQSIHPPTETRSPETNRQPWFYEMSQWLRG
jgi:hypothetical protein